MNRPYLYCFNRVLSNREIGSNSYVINLDKGITVIAPKQVTARLIAGVKAKDIDVVSEVRKQIDNYVKLINKEI